MFDIAVVGLGALGASVAAAAARSGLSVIGLEAAGPANEIGATGGRTRIFRSVYTFGADYVPALLESARHWQELEARHPGSVWSPHGALLIGHPDDPEIRAALASAETHEIEHDLLTEAELAARWPQFRLFPDDIAIADPLGAVMYPQRVTATLAGEAVAHGAQLRYGTAVTAWETAGSTHTLTTADGTTICARRLIIAAGAWSARFVPAFGDQIELRRAVLHWFATDDPSAYGPDRFPVGLRRSGDIRYSFFPQTDASGIKINMHLPKPLAPDADTPGTVPDDYGAEMLDGLRATLPGVRERTAMNAVVESYSPDYRIVVDEVPDRSGAWIIAAGSGQAFKLAPVLAEHLLCRVLETDRGPVLNGVVRPLHAPIDTTVVGP